MNITHILHPTDFTEGSAAAFEYVKSLGKLYDAEITLIVALDDISKSGGWYVPHTSLDELYKDMEAQATKKLDHCCYEELSNFKKVNRVVRKGTPEDVILDYAKKNCVDLIVMGSHTKSGMDFVFSSTAEKVVKKAECPVLCVKAKAA